MASMSGCPGQITTAYSNCLFPATYLLWLPWWLCDELGDSVMSHKFGEDVYKVWWVIHNPVSLGGTELQQWTQVSPMTVHSQPSRFTVCTLLNPSLLWPMKKLYQREQDLVVMNDKHTACNILVLFCLLFMIRVQQLSFVP
jgi:hypothetical protein